MKIANFEFNVEALSRMTRDEFIAKHKGILKADINQAANDLNKYFKKEEVRTNNEQPKKSRKRKKK